MIEGGRPLVQKLVVLSKNRGGQHMKPTVSTCKFAA